MVNERLRGWYTRIHGSQFVEIYEWCKNNLQGYWKIGDGVYIRELYMGDSEDVMLFTLRWS